MPVAINQSTAVRRMSLYAGNTDKVLNIDTVFVLSVKKAT